MRSATLLFFCSVVGVLGGGDLVAQSPSSDFQRRAAQMRAEHQRRAAQMRAEHERRVAEMKRQQASSPNTSASSRSSGSSSPSNNTRSSSSTPQRSSSSPASFNAAAAPHPVECLARYVLAARSAHSMEQVLPFLPQAEQESLKAAQKRYDPSDVARQRKFFQDNGNNDEKSLTFLTNPPYVNALDRHQRIAHYILDVLNVRIEENVATIRVSTNNGGTANGIEYPYGTAIIKMQGEGRTWKFDSYNDGNVMYLHPPQPKQDF